MLNKVLARIVEVQEILESKGFPKFDIKTEIKTLKAGVAGSAYLHKNEIHISKEYLEEFSEEILKDTVAHEVCHLYVTNYKPFAKQHHGKEFRAFMNMLGLDGKTHHAMQLKQPIPDNTRLKTRFVYITNESKKIVHLTPQQHKKALTGIIYKANNEYITYTGKKHQFK